MQSIYSINPAYTFPCYIWIFYSLPDIKFYYVITIIIFETIVLFLIIINILRSDLIRQGRFIIKSLETMWENGETCKWDVF